MNTLTSKDLLDSIRKSTEHLHPDDFPIPRMNPFRPLSFGGLDVRTVPARPKIQLGEAAPVSDRCRAEFNAWLWQAFGDAKPIVPLGSAYMFGNHVVMNEHDFNILKMVSA